MSLASGMGLELATLPTNSNGTCRSSIATRYQDPTAILSIHETISSTKPRCLDVEAVFHVKEIHRPPCPLERLFLREFTKS